ncbi:MAG: membrane integrity-associated transporter subunit PqiC [Deltaproteobacteria bacterium]|nr:membrane integrity-associated transporter subunit PqiC [Deltaproteobacteria bacterium]
MKAICAGMALVLVLAAAGCWLQKEPAPPVTYHLPSYEAPEPSERPALAAEIRVKRLSVSPAFDTRFMVYHKENGAWGQYPYHLWRAEPGMLVADYLARDLSKTGWFALAANPGEGVDARFSLEGVVREFYENDEPGGWKAVLVLDLALLDRRAPDVPGRVLFQNTYQYSCPARKKAPSAVARAMGDCLRRASARVMDDIYAAIARRLDAKSKE